MLGLFHEAEDLVQKTMLRDSQAVPGRMVGMLSVGSDAIRDGHGAVSVRDGQLPDRR
ncbi:hypothetical protein ACFY3G_12365 [Streptomyces phaeochromogenes]|uniref:hypothetical protein n=1 Tax=Streptomyces phaeochromogenes TaxID=1923 RepID=UPI003681150D